MVKKSKPEQRFSGPGFSFCVVNGTIYHLYDDGTYDSSYPRLKVREAVEFMRKQLAPSLRQRAVINRMKAKRDEFDRETNSLNDGFLVKIANLQKEVVKLQNDQCKLVEGRRNKRDQLCNAIAREADEMHNICCLRDKKNKQKIRFDHEVKRVCVGCNEVPLDVARKLAVALARMAKKK